jgi:hypothetical protein
MRPHKRRHKKNLRYWLKKLFPGFYRNKRSDSSDSSELGSIRFLTLEEVKVAQAEAREREGKGEDTEHFTVFEEASRPQPPQRHLHSKGKKKGVSRLFRYISKIRFKLWKSKRNRSEQVKYEYLTIEDINRAKAAQANFANAHPSGEVTRLSSPELQQDSKPLNKHMHKRRKKRFWQKFRFGKKKEQPAVYTPLGEIGEPEKEKAPLKVYIRSTLTSTAIFIIAYYLSWFIYQLSVMVVASFSKIDSVLYYYEVMFPIGNYSPKWNQTNIIFITLSGPLISLIFWALYRFVFLRKFHPGSQVRTLLVWLCLNSMMLFFGAFVGGAITRQGFGYVVDWLYMNIAFRSLFSMMFLSLIVWLNWKIVRFLPENSGLDSWKHNRYGFVLSRLIVPWFIGGGVLILLKITDVIPQHENIFNYDAFTIATLLFAVLPPMFNSKTRPHLIQGRKTYPRIRKSSAAAWVLAAIALTILIRFGLSKGLFFQLIFDLNLGIYH